ncbi:hypothetical protein VPHK469_0109 [Vibrio phage K469]
MKKLELLKLWLCATLVGYIPLAPFAYLVSTKEFPSVSPFIGTLGLSPVVMGIIVMAALLMPDMSSDSEYRGY